MTALIGILAFLVLGPLVGGLLAGADRILTARMQSRVGPPILQPFYDIGKLWGKQGTVVNRHQTLYIWCFLAFVMSAGRCSSPAATCWSACSRCRGRGVF